MNLLSRYSLRYIVLLLPVLLLSTDGAVSQDNLSHRRPVEPAVIPLDKPNSQQVLAVKPSIVVSDIDFGTAPVGLPALVFKNFHITNRGDAVLSVKKNTGVVPSSLASVFDITELKNTTFPLVIEDVNSGFNVKNFAVKFTPNKVGPFDATITFSSNATGIDSVCRLHGVGIAPGIGCNAVDFGRRRIGGSYENDVESGIAQIMVNNTLAQNLSITKATASGNISEFEIPDLSVFSGMTLAGAQQSTHSIRFTPTKPGYDTLRISFLCSTGNTIVFRAVGVGVVAKALFESVVFDTVDIGSATKFSAKQIRITSLDMSTIPKWEFYDELAIDSLVVLGSGKEIGSGGQTDVGSEGFSYNLSQFELPLVIPSGLSSKAFDVWYQPTKAGTNTARLQLGSNASEQPISVWTGTAVGVPQSVSDDVSGHLTLSPLPAYTFVELFFSTEEARSVLLFNSVGEQLQSIQSSGDSFMRLDLQSIPCGVYSLVIHGAESTLYRRFVKL